MCHSPGKKALGCPLTPDKSLLIMMLLAFCAMKEVSHAFGKIRVGGSAFPAATPLSTVNAQPARIAVGAFYILP